MRAERRRVWLYTVQRRQEVLPVSLAHEVLTLGPMAKHVSGTTGIEFWYHWLAWGFGQTRALCAADRGTWKEQ